MNEKHAAICHLTFFESGKYTFSSVLGYGSAVFTAHEDGIRLPVVGAELSEIRSAVGNSVEVELSARITDTSKASEDRLTDATFRYGVIVLGYTDGTKRLLGTPYSPIYMEYEKSGIPASFVLSIKGIQPEPAKLLV